MGVVVDQRPGGQRFRLRELLQERFPLRQLQRPGGQWLKLPDALLKLRIQPAERPVGGKPGKFRETHQHRVADRFRGQAGFRRKADAVKGAVPVQVLRGEHHKIAAFVEVPRSAVRTASVHGNIHALPRDHHLLTARRIDLKGDQQRQHVAGIDGRIAGKQQRVRHNRHRGIRRHHPVSRYEIPEQEFAAGKQPAVAFLQLLPQAALRRGDQHGLAPHRRFRLGVVETLKRRLLDRNLGNVAPQLGHFGGDPLGISADYGDVSVGVGGFKLGEKTGALRQAVEIAAAEIANDRFDVVGSGTKDAVEIVNIVLTVAGPAAAGAVVEPLAVDFEPVETVGGDGEAGGDRQRGQAEIAAEDGAEVVAAAVGVVGPDPVGDDIHESSPKIKINKKVKPRSGVATGSLPGSVRRRSAGR